MSRALQIVLPTDDLRVSLISQIEALRKSLGRTPAVLRRSVNKQFGVTRGLDDLVETQLSEVLLTLEQLAERRAAIERVRGACATRRVTAAGLDVLLERHFDGRSLDQLSADELTELRLRIEEDRVAAAGTEPEPAAALM
jgi:hypothetical protein